jgi:hypothetical protein
MYRKYFSYFSTILVCTCVKIARWERRIIVLPRRTNLKVISFAAQGGNRAAPREFGILKSNVRCCWKQKELLKTGKSDSRAFRGPNAGKSAYFTHPDFLAAKLDKKVRKLRE